MTDWQQPLVVALTQAEGVSIVHETVYETPTRLHRGARHDGCDDPGLPRLPRWHRRAASVAVTSSTRRSSPARRKLHGADIVVPDLRGGFSHLIAALAAEGTSHVYGVDLINRGYEDFEAKLAALGADVERPVLVS